MRTKIIAVMGAVVVASCAYTPVIDTKNVNMVDYQKDLAECQALADQSDDSLQTSVVGGVIGGLLGVALAVIVDDPSYVVAGVSAGVGAFAGAAGGATVGEMDKKGVVRNCLKGRGYSVLK